MTQQNPPAGWYPQGDSERWWDGSQWTDQRRPFEQRPDRDPDALWQAVGKPVKGFGAGRYKLTAHYLFFEKGTLRTDSQQVPVAAVLDVDLMQSMTQKARNVGTIRVQIQRPTRVEIVLLEDVQDYREGVRLINETAHAARLAVQRHQNTHRYESVVAAQHAPATAEPQEAPSAAPAVDLVVQLRQLGELRDAGILTEEEFAAKKAEILGRL